MWPTTERLLLIWTALAGLWWLIALTIVWRNRSHSDTIQSAANALPTLSVFKALPPLFGRAVSPALISALETFVRQLDPTVEILLGVEEVDRAQWEPVINAWQQKYPGARLEVACVPRPQTFLSPKVSWYHTLAARARGELWMWSDADIIAPPGFLQRACAELRSGSFGLLTAPYIVSKANRAPMLLEALFVNVEFFPGVQFCKRIGAARFSFGACLLFSAETFRQRVKWEQLGARIADDFLLGQLLSPVKLSDVTLDTLATETSWREAVQHYLRWHKTVRWLRPAGYAGQLLITPVLGWLIAALTHPTAGTLWAGVALTVQMEVIAAVLLSGMVGCRVSPSHLLAVEGWSLLRALTWLACWFPWPVVFRSQGRKWWSLYRSTTIS